MVNLDNVKHIKDKFFDTKGEVVKIEDSQGRIIWKKASPIPQGLDGIYKPSDTLPKSESWQYSFIPITMEELQTYIFNQDLYNEETNQIEITIKQKEGNPLLFTFQRIDYNGDIITDISQPLDVNENWQIGYTYQGPIKVSIRQHDEYFGSGDFYANTFLEADVYPMLTGYSTIGSAPTFISDLKIENSANMSEGEKAFWTWYLEKAQFTKVA